MIKVLLIILSGILVIDQATFEKQPNPKPATEIVYTAQILPEEDLQEKFFQQEVDCLTRNIYFEARNQSIEGQYAVAEVVLNRMHNPNFPQTICEIVQEKTKDGCQFSWFCDGKSDKMRDKIAIVRAKAVAISSINNKTNFTGGALFYHASYVSPGWDDLKKTVEIEDHIFYSSI